MRNGALLGLVLAVIAFGVCFAHAQSSKTTGTPNAQAVGEHEQVSPAAHQPGAELRVTATSHILINSAAFFPGAIFPSRDAAYKLEAGLAFRF